jgi:hypothetical protein
MRVKKFLLTEIFFSTMNENIDQYWELSVGAIAVIGKVDRAA